MAAFDFSKVGTIHEKRTDSTDPVSFFYELNHPDIKDLYPSQSDVLKDWYQSFSGGTPNDSCIVQLDTGAGKTLIGLLIAESIRRKTGKKVLYACPNNFLVEQTIEKAVQYGINVSSYHDSQWKNHEEFLRNETICVTNNSSVTVGGSIFRRLEDIGGIIFDDAHGFADEIEKRQSVSIEGETLAKLASIFNSESRISAEISSTINDGGFTPYLVPPYLFWKYSNLLRLELDPILREDNKLKYAWKFIKDRLDSCFLFFSKGKAEISMILPDNTDNFFLSANIHKVFLSATIGGEDDFIRRLGIDPSVISVSNPSYRPDRLFLFGNLIKKQVPDFEQAFINEIATVSPKCLILTPSRADFSKFSHLEADLVNESGEAKAKIEDFKKAESGILVIANRYEGIDIDGDSGHFLVVFDMSNIASLKNSYLASVIGGRCNTGLRMSFAGKITQALGRTTRSANDYSTIVLLGDNLNNVLINKSNESLFGKALLEDLKIGQKLSENIGSFESFLDLVRMNLSQDPAYKSHIRNERTNIQGIGTDLTPEQKELLKKIAKQERKIINALAARDYPKCATLITHPDFEISMANSGSLKLFALYLSIGANCFAKIGNYAEANRLHARCVGIDQKLGISNFRYGSDEASSKQAEKLMNCPIEKSLDFSRSVSASNFEENLRKLGEMLGFESIRPEKRGDLGTTLDNLWISDEDGIVIGFECKNEKANGWLTMEEVGQSLNHVQWIKSTYPKHELRYFIVGDISEITGSSQPGEDVYVLSFNDITSAYLKVRTLLEGRTAYPISDAEIAEFKIGAKVIFNGKKASELPRKK